MNLGLDGQRINIVGRAGSSRLAPETGNVWGLTSLITSQPCDLTIDMNDYSDNRWGFVETELDQLTQRLCERRGLIYIGLHNYPLQKMIDYYGVDFFSSSVDYAMALAIYQNPAEIHLYGVNLGTDSEYAYQRPGCHFWIGQAMGRGIDVKIHGDSSLMRNKNDELYGYYAKQDLDKVYAVAENSYDYSLEVLKKEVLLNGKPETVCGLAKFHVSPQGRGFGRKVIRRLETIAGDKPIIGFCLSKVRGFYRKCGWYEIGNFGRTIIVSSQDVKIEVEKGW